MSKLVIVAGTKVPTTPLKLRKVGLFEKKVRKVSYIKHIKIQNKTQTTQTINKDCIPPQWAINIGHAEKWKLHHGCK